jgi:queuine/archaeosine tRNA-ribosyltransferase
MEIQQAIGADIMFAFDERIYLRIPDASTGKVRHHINPNEREPKW